MAEVTAKVVGSDPITISYNFGDTDEEFVNNFGLPVVVTHARSSMVVAIQDIIRTGIKEGKSQKEIQAAADKWRPSLKRKGKSKAEQLAEKFADLSDEDRKNLLKRLREAA